MYTSSAFQIERVYSDFRITFSTDTDKNPLILQGHKKLEHFFDSIDSKGIFLFAAYWAFAGAEKGSNYCMGLLYDSII
jgi:hypothetical protein